jgi:hypothetical protein
MDEQCNEVFVPKIIPRPSPAQFSALPNLHPEIIYIICKKNTTQYSPFHRLGPKCASISPQSIPSVNILLSGRISSAQWPAFRTSAHRKTRRVMVVSSARMCLRSSRWSVVRECVLIAEQSREDGAPRACWRG